MSFVVTNSDGSSSNNIVQLIQSYPSSQLHIKLIGATNFSTWKAQITMLLHGHALYGYIDGYTVTPPATITEATKQVPNPAFTVWFRQDKLIQNALLASVDPTLASIVATSPSSKAAWDSLHLSYANKSHTRVLSLIDQLSRSTKDEKSIAEYLHEVRNICDELEVVSSPLPNAELVLKILNGLGCEYKNIAAGAHARADPIYFKELSIIFQDQEICLKYDKPNDVSKGLVAPLTAAVAQHRSNQMPRSQRCNGSSWQQRVNSTPDSGLQAFACQPWRN